MIGNIFFMCTLTRLRLTTGGVILRVLLSGICGERLRLLIGDRLIPIK